MKSFASDNNAGVHPAVFAALQAANLDHVPGYGDDPITAAAIEKFKRHFGDSAEVYFVYGGTGANVVGLSSVMSSYQAIICAETAHINVDECGAPERLIGCKLIDVPTSDGKLTPALIQPHLHGFGEPHHAQPHVVSISQSTEMGTLYTADEIRAIADLAHAHGMLLHVDGARISNAAVSLDLEFRQFTRESGVDVLSFGGTKNGLMYGEAVIFFDPRLAVHTPFLRKQSMQLASKMRFIAAQFDALLTDNLWKKNAENANRMAALLAQEVSALPDIRLTQPVQANGVFAIVPPAIIPVLLEEYFFYMWNEANNEVRWMTAFDTTQEDVERFVAAIKRALSHQPA